MSRMDHFIDMYYNNSLLYLISKSGENFGSLCKPTGVGKSWDIISDTIYHINKRNIR